MGVMEKFGNGFKRLVEGEPINEDQSDGEKKPATRIKPDNNQGAFEGGFYAHKKVIEDLGLNLNLYSFRLIGADEYALLTQTEFGKKCKIGPKNLRTHFVGYYKTNVGFQLEGLVGSKKDAPQPLSLNKNGAVRLVLVHEK